MPPRSCAWWPPLAPAAMPAPAALGAGGPPAAPGRSLRGPPGHGPRLGSRRPSSDPAHPRLAPALRQQVIHSALAHDADVAAEAPRGVVPELGEDSEQARQHLLADVLAVGLGQPAVPGPGVDQAAVAADELLPGRLV